MKENYDDNSTKFLGLFDSLDPIKKFDTLNEEGHYFILKVSLNEFNPFDGAPLYDLDDDDFVFGGEDWSYFNTEAFEKWQKGIDDESDDESDNKSDDDD